MTGHQKPEPVLMPDYFFRLLIRTYLALALIGALVTVALFVIDWRISSVVVGCCSVAMALFAGLVKLLEVMVADV